MKLLSIEEIAEFLTQKFKDVDPEIMEELDDVLLKTGRFSQNDILEFRSKLRINDLSSNFETVICEYSFDNFTLANVQFGYKGDYLKQLVENNSETQYWYEDARKNNVLVIANSDPFNILLGISDGLIYAISSDISWEKKIIIANSFSEFIQGLGTAEWAKSCGKTQDFIKLANNKFGKKSLNFWQSIL